MFIVNPYRFSVAGESVIKSALMFDGSADYLTFTPNGSGNRRAWSASMWIKKADDAGGDRVIFSGDSSGAGLIRHINGDALQFDENGGSQRLTTSAVFRDYSAWQHVVAVWDSDNSTSDDRMRIFINGSRITSFSSKTQPSINTDSSINQASVPFVIGAGADSGPGQFFRGYIAEVIFLDGVATTDASSFGENDSNGVWVPKDPSDTSNISDWGGSNSFWLKFDDGSNIGKNSRPTTVSTVDGSYKIDKSLWLDGSADELTFTPSQDGTGAGKKYTLSFWTKAVDPDDEGSFFCAGNSGGDSLHIQTNWNSGNEFLNFNDSSTSGSNWLRRTGTRRLRDTTAWMHICFAVDNSSAGGLAGSPNAARVYINGVEDTSFSNANAHPASSDTSRMTMQYEHVIGNGSGFDDFKDMYIAEFIIVDGQQLAPTSFGGWDTNGNWVPVDPSALSSLTGQVLIPQNTGSTIGTMNTRTSAAFDGNNNQDEYAAATHSSALSTATIGKDFGAGNGKAVNQVKVWGYSGGGFTSNASQTCTITVKGSNTGLGSNEVTLFTSGTIADTTDANAQDFSFSNSTAYRYVYIELTQGVSNYFFVAELEFYAEGTVGFGTNGTWLEFGDSSDIGKDSVGGSVKQDISSATATNPGGGLHNFSGSGVLDDDTAQDGFYLSGDEAGQTVDVDLGSGNNLAVTAAGWIVENNGGNNQAAVWSIFYSDNGSDWTDTSQNLTVADDGSSMSEQRTLITGQTAHRYWRLSIDSTTGNSNGWYSGLRLYTGGSSRFANNWTPVSIASTQVVTDSPTNTAADNEGNYATWNPLASSPNNTFSEGNLRCAMPSSGSTQTVRGSVVIQSGKWHWEATLNSGSGSWIGVLQGTNSATNINYSGDTLPGAVGVSMTYCDDGKIYNDNGGGAGGSGISSTAPATYSAGDRITVELNADDNEIQFFKNGSSQVTITSGLAPPYIPTMFRGSNPNITINFGQTAFTDTPSTGFKALNTANLAETTVTDPRKYYATMLYETTAKYRSVRQCFDSTGTAWTPDFLWFKDRDATTNFTIVDSVRGANSGIMFSSANVAEQVPTYDGILSFIEGGFTTGADSSSYYNNPADRSYVAFALRAGGAASANGNGSVASVVSAADHGGFSIGTFTAGTAGGITVGHGLDRAPGMVIVKSRDAAGGWWVYHDGLSPSDEKYLRLESTTYVNEGGADNASVWNSTDPSPTVFSTRDNNLWLTSGQKHVFYAWARTPGMIGIGSYTGNNSPNGAYVVIDDGASGFRPAWLMIKRSDSGAHHWRIWDAARSVDNVVEDYLGASSTGQEYGAGVGKSLDFTSNGFKLRTNDTDMNAAGTYIYLAFADQPFNLARAR